MKYKVLAFCGMFLLGGTINAQVNLKDSVVFAPLFQGTFAVQSPGGDLADRFGLNANVGGAFLFKTKGNWLIGMDGNFLFGSIVKEDEILDPLETTEGNILDQNGEFAEIFLIERGFSFTAKFGKMFPVFGPNPNSGIVITGGIGFLQHKIRIQNKNGPTVPALAGEYKKGYDRLSNGTAITEFVGYYYLGNRKLINFFVGFEFTQAFTQNRRDFNFDTGMAETGKRVDHLNGIRVGWMLPLYKRAPKAFYYD